MADALTADRHAAPARRPGAIILTRHGEPDIARDVKLNAAGYRAFWTSYEQMGIIPGQAPPAALRQVVAEAGVLISSTRLRSRQSAEMLAAGKAFTSQDILVEAPLPPPHWPSWLRISPKLWGFFARFWWWFFNHHEGQETRRQAEVRADKAAAMLEDLAASGQDVVVTAHGFFNFMIGRALKARGWRMESSQGYRYWSIRRFERT
jgi:broad specificity phosphatase PhoE